jgi:hypothetical protein
MEPAILSPFTHTNDVDLKIVEFIPNQDLANFSLVSQWCCSSLTDGFLLKRIPRDLSESTYNGNIRRFVFHKLCLSKDDVFRRMEDFISTYNLFDNCKMNFFSTKNLLKPYLQISGVDSQNIAPDFIKTKKLFVSSEISFNILGELRAKVNNEDCNKELAISFDQIDVNFEEKCPEFLKFIDKMGGDILKIEEAVNARFPEVMQVIQNNRAEYVNDTEYELLKKLLKSYPEEFNAVAHDLNTSECFKFVQNMPLTPIEISKYCYSLYLEENEDDFLKGLLSTLNDFSDVSSPSNERLTSLFDRWQKNMCSQNQKYVDFVTIKPNWEGIPFVNNLICEQKRMHIESIGKENNRYIEVILEKIKLNDEIMSLRSELTNEKFRKIEPDTKATALIQTITSKNEEIINLKNQLIFRNRILLVLMIAMVGIIIANSTLSKTQN